MRILHLGGNEKFLPPFIDFVEEHFNPAEHEFLLTPGMGGELHKKNVSVFQRTVWWRLQFYLRVLRKIQGADKIILHGLFDPPTILLLYLNPWVLAKSYWCIWGGDLYDHQAKVKNTKWKIRNFFKRKIIPKIGHLITHIRGDFELAKQWYGAKGQWHDCFMYTSNVFKDQKIITTPHVGINILLGNSATASNNHLDALEKLRPFAQDDIQIFCPLSYGDTVYAEQIERAGKSIFGEKFIALRNLLPFEEYLQLLASIDIAIFNHDRQQAVGNITQLLGLGKTVYIRKNVTTWGMLTRLNIKINNINELTIGDIESKNPELQSKTIKEIFSEKNLATQWRAIYD